MAQVGIASWQENLPLKAYEDAVTHSDGVLVAKNGKLSGSSITGVWERKGIIVPIAEEPQVIWEFGSFFFTGYGSNVFKMWFSGVGGINYAESKDALNWTTSIVVAPGSHHCIYNTGGIYYLYTTVGGDLDLYTSTDGITFALDTANTVPRGGGGSWDDTMIANPCVWKEGANWYMVYEGTDGVGIWETGLATSNNGRAWTKDVGNPVYSLTDTGVSGFDVHKVGAIYYAWDHEAIPLFGVLPTDGYFLKSANLITWSKVFTSPVLPRWTDDDGAGQREGQVADLNLVEANGKVYCFYTSKFNQITANIKLAIANFNFTNLVTVPFQGPALNINNGNVAIGRAASPIDWGGDLPAKLDIDAWGGAVTTDALRIKQVLYANHFNMLSDNYFSVWSGRYDGVQFNHELHDKQLWLMDNNDIEFRQHNPYTVLFLGGDGSVGIGTSTPHYPLTLIGLTNYANDAAAGIGGLTTGDFYTETGSNPKRVCVKI